ncbi:MAG: YgcG family protein [Bradyrhizobium sp.]|uniref:TPM domain-containing protein n=1 Tax=Bradyrhizobium sp. TaxID=376 RepID=UPI0025C4620A|nr:YgcG family protein [Bradyrhizobium sp.]MBI5264555.1 YgcG family protein [Bradyrhizobium sp.]
MNAVRAFLLALFVVGVPFTAAADVAVPPLTGRVVDQTGTLSSSDISELSEKLKAFEDRKGSQIAVLIVPTVKPETIEQFAIRVGETWKIGRKNVDDGAILVIAKNDRHLRIEVGYGLEGSLTDATSRRIIDEDITPKFKSGDFAGGISAGVDRMMNVIDGEQLPVPEPAHWNGPHLADYIDPFNMFFLVGLLLVAGMLRASFGRLMGSIASGGLVAVLTWLFFGSLIVSVVAGIIGGVVAFIADLIPGSGPSVGGRRSSSSSSSWSSGSSSSSGSFSGGGGSFGGGGASGSW